MMANTIWTMTDWATVGRKLGSSYIRVSYEQC